MIVPRINVTGKIKFSEKITMRIKVNVVKVSSTIKNFASPELKLIGMSAVISRRNNIVIMNSEILNQVLNANNTKFHILEFTIQCTPQIYHLF